MLKRVCCSKRRHYGARGLGGCGFWSLTLTRVALENILGLSAPRPDFHVVIVFLNKQMGLCKILVKTFLKNKSSELGLKIFGSVT